MKIDRTILEKVFAEGAKAAIAHTVVEVSGPLDGDEYYYPLTDNDKVNKIGKEYLDKLLKDLEKF